MILDPDALIVPRAVSDATADYCAGSPAVTLTDFGSSPEDRHPELGHAAGRPHKCSFPSIDYASSDLADWLAAREGAGFQLGRDKSNRVVRISVGQPTSHPKRAAHTPRPSFRWIRPGRSVRLFGWTKLVRARGRRDHVFGGKRFSSAWPSHCLCRTETVAPFSFPRRMATAFRFTKHDFAEGSPCRRRDLARIAAFERADIIDRMCEGIGL